ncbi:MAG: radical SAM protein [Candidatus Aminicenantes bacterium]|nr:radical SAM protein [Candidatus Aminicenantes bacterium]
MEVDLSGFTIILTTDCNFHCTYCYQPRSKLYLNQDAALKAVGFFFPFFSDGCFVSFYGGEPLLAFDTIRKVTAHVESLSRKTGKNVRFSITTNGSLITEEIIDYLDAHRFYVMLSFDGPAQDEGRQKGSGKNLVSVLDRMLERSGIETATSSVFTPETAEYLVPAARFFMERGVPRIDLTYSSLSVWEEKDLVRLEKSLASLRPHVLARYRTTGEIPVSHFARGEGSKVFSCSAGLHQLALSPEGDLWGCCYFYDLARRESDSLSKSSYSFGSLDSFIANPEKTYRKTTPEYTHLDMEHFFTREGPCMMCPDIGGCAVCPAYAAFKSSILGMIPFHTCRIRKILCAQVRKFWEEARGI